MPRQIDFEGRVAAITGATRGIGAASAEALAGAGASLILNARDAASLETMADALRRRHGGAVHVHPGDIADPATSQGLAKLAFSQFRRLDVLVGNAGILRDGVIGMIREGDMDETLDTNLRGVLHGIQACARVMQRGGGGSIVNVSSIIGREGNRGQMVYAASKAGVIGATLAAAKELAPQGIRVNAVAPGYIDTPMIEGIPEDIHAERLASIGMGRIGTADDVADAILFLASDLSRYVTGQVIGVDGGMVI